MGCLLENGYSIACRDNIGGILRVYIGNYDTNLSLTYDTDNTIIGVTGSTSSYYTFEQEMETADYNQSGQFSTENGTVFYDQQLNLIFHKNDSELRNLLIVLSQSNLSVIIVDQRDQAWLMGVKNGVRAISGEQKTGKAYGDLNGVTITLQAKEPFPAHRIDDINLFNIVGN